MRDLNYDRTKLEELCQAYHVKRLAVFGSVLTGQERPGSDLDILVEFDSEQGPGWGMFTLEEKLSALFDTAVDLNTPGFLSKYFREEVLGTAHNIYVA